MHGLDLSQNDSNFLDEEAKLTPVFQRLPMCGEAYHKHNSAALAAVQRIDPYQSFLLRSADACPSFDGRNCYGHGPILRCCIFSYIFSFGAGISATDTTESTAAWI